MSRSVPKRILYVTADGLLQALGYSQVVRVVSELAQRGQPYDILSMERAQDLERKEDRAALERHLRSVDVNWSVLHYEEPRSSAGAIRNIARLCTELTWRTVTRRYALIHARSYHGAFAAALARRATGTPYLFDARGYWIDERLESGRWFSQPFALRVAREVERQLFVSAAAVVTLTELQANDVRSGSFGPAGRRPVVVIPTCADYDEFRPGQRDHFDHVPEQVRARLSGKLVIGLVGAVNRFYLSEDSVRLLARILDLSEAAHVLAISAQQSEHLGLFSAHGIPPERYTVVSAAHWAMPEWMSLMDWAIMLLDETPAKRAAMPTKLAEFFAAGVRIVQFGCNSEVRDWVARSGSGWILPDLQPPSLNAAARHITSAPRNEHALRAARERTEAHFGLASGVSRYHRLLTELLRGPQ